jgi:uncharacterized RDD family membrane protein YckC
MAEIASSTPTKSLAGASSEIMQPSGDAAPLEKPDRVTAVSNLALGSLLMAIEALDDWVDRNVPTQALALEQRARRQGALLPQSEWEATYGRTETDRVRLAAMGAAMSASNRAVRATRSALRTGNLAADVARWPLDNIFLFSPLRHGVDRLTEAGNQQIDRWVQVGKTLDTGSRAVAEVSLGRAAQDSVGLMTGGEPHVQALIQEIIAGQGTSITKEIIDEVREHSLSLDMRVDKAWATLRRRQRAEVAAPDFAVAIPGKKPDAKEMAGRPYLGGAYAGIVSRVLAFSIDVFALIVALVIAWVFVRAIISIFSLDQLLPGLFGPSATIARIAGPSALTSLIACIYWMFGWMFLGGTAGKILMGLRVVGPGGSRLGFWRSLRRVIGYFISAFALGLGFLWVIINKRHHSWADKLASSSVVYAWHARPDETFLAAPPAENP